MSSPAPRSHFPLAIWLGFATFFLRIVSLIRLSKSPHFLPDQGDMKFYSDWALRILQVQWTDGLAFYGLPGYAFFLAGIYKFLGFDPFVVGFLQAAADALSAVLIVRIAEIVFSDENPGSRTRATTVGAVAALGWMLFQPAQAFSVVLMPTTWLVLAFWASVYWIVQIQATSWWHPWLWMGLLFGVVSMMIATILFLVPLAVVAIWFRTYRGEWRAIRTVAAMGMLATGLFAGAAPCWLHNYFIADEPVMLSAHSGVNFYIGNNAAANGYPKIPEGLRAGQAGMLKDSITLAEAAAGRPLQRAEVSEFWSAKARDFISHHPGKWLGLLGIKFRNFWNAYQYDDLSLVTLFREAGIVTPGLRFGWVAALAIPGMIIGAWKYRRSRWIVAAVCLHLAALMPVFVTERYRLAAVPGLLLMAGIGLYEFWSSLAGSRWRMASGYAAAVVAAATFVSWPQSDPGLWSLDYYNTGLKATIAGDLPRAQQNLEMAYAYVSDNAEINFALGNLWVEKKDTTRAKQFYRQAIELNPRHASAYNNLGVLALEERRWAVAERFFGLSVEIEPEDAKTHYLLGGARLELGDIPGATAAVDRALALLPGHKQSLALKEAIRKFEESARQYP